MKRVIRSIVRLYPARWRDRYRTEFDALLEDMSPGWRDLFDVLKGALTMRMSMATLGRSVALFGVAGALLAGGLSFTLRDRYRSVALVAMSMPKPAELSQLSRTVLSQDALIGIMEEQHLYERERASQPVEQVIHKMRQDISIRIQGPSAFEVSFDYPDAAQAQQTNAELLGRLVDENVRITGSPELRTIEKPSAPQAPIGPNRTAITGLGLSAGILMGAIVAWVRRPKTQPVV
jgi:hypothetical protein